MTRVTPREVQLQEVSADEVSAESSWCSRLQEDTAAMPIPKVLLSMG